MLIGKKKLKRVSLLSDVDAKDSDDLVPIDSSLLFRPWKNEQDSSVDREDAKSDHSSIRAEVRQPWTTVSYQTSPDKELRMIKLSACYHLYIHVYRSCYHL